MDGASGGAGGTKWDRRDGVERTDRQGGRRDVSGRRDNWRMDELPQLVARAEALARDSGWRGGAEALLGLVRSGGRIVMDDVTPVRAQHEDSPYRGGDPKRELFFGRPDLVSAEVVLPDLENSLLVGTRR